MATEILATDLKNRLVLRTKTIGADKIRKAKDNNEEIAVLSMFLPGATAAKENQKFKCHLGMECRLGDYRDTTPGIFEFCSFYVVRMQNLFQRYKNLPNYFFSTLHCKLIANIFEFSALLHSVL